MNVSVDIRPATLADVPALYAMLRASAEAQGGLAELCVDENALREDGFGTAPRFQALLATIDDEPAGMALYYFSYSTWTSRNGFYLEDLFVKPERRGQGIARCLMRHLAAIAREHGCARFNWFVLRDNAPAIRFYEKLGGTELVRWMPMQLPPEKRDALIEGGAR